MAVLARGLAFSMLAIGLGLAMLGGALFLNVLSLRELALATRLGPVMWVVFATRDELSHRRAQWIELMVGLLGTAIALVTLLGWWLQARNPGVRTGA